VAIFSNFVRVATLILVTYYFGEAAGQGFIHDFAGLTVFLVALLTIFGADALFSGFRERRRAKA
jgi:exosortase/archaeosortase family protein